MNEGFALFQSSTARPLIFQMLQAADGYTPITGISPTVTISKNGAAFGAVAGAVTEISGGFYKVAGNATDTNTIGSLSLLATGTGARPAYITFTVGPNPADMVEISADATAADRFETMLDGSGGNQLSLSNLTLTGELSVASNFEVSGSVLFNTNFEIAGLIQANAISIIDTADIGGAVTFGSTFTVTGAVLATDASNDIRGVRLGVTGLANVASAIWQDSTAGDFTTASSIGKALYIANVVPGGSGGHLISGANTGTVTLGRLDIAGDFNVDGTVTWDGANNILLGAISNTAIGTATNVVLSAAHGSGPWGYLPGPGPNAITVTVTDGSSDLQSAAVGLYQANVLVANGVTDVNGNITFSLAAGTYQAVVAKANYQFAPTNRTVTGPQTGTLINDLVMTAIGPVTPPVNPDLCAVFGFLLLPNGLPAQNVEVVLSLSAPNGRRPTTTGGSIVSFTSVTATTDASGFFSQDVIRTDVLDQSNYQYTIFCEAANINVRTAVASGTLDVASL